MYNITVATFREPTAMLEAILESEEMTDDAREEIERELERREDELNDRVYIAELEQRQTDGDAYA